MAEQQLRARQMVLQQQAASAVAAASKTQREVRTQQLRGLVDNHVARIVHAVTISMRLLWRKTRLNPGVIS